MIRGCLNCIFAVSVISTPGAAQTKSASQTGFEATARIFDYDAEQPLDVHDKIIGEFSDGTGFVLFEVFDYSLHEGLLLGAEKVLG